MKRMVFRAVCICGQFVPFCLWLQLYWLSHSIKSGGMGVPADRDAYLREYLSSAVPALIAACFIYLGVMLVVRHTRTLFDFSSGVTFWGFIVAAIPLILFLPIGTAAAAFGWATIVSLRRSQRLCVNEKCTS